MYNSLAAVCEDMQSNGISVVECELKSNPSLCMEKGRIVNEWTRQEFSQLTEKELKSYELRPVTLEERYIRQFSNVSKSGDENSADQRNLETGIDGDELLCLTDFYFTYTPRKYLFVKKKLTPEDEEICDLRIPHLQIEKGEIYKLIGPDNKMISARKTLSSMGISDGDTISIIAVNDTPVNIDTIEKAQLTVRIANSGELIPIFDVNFEKETNEDLIRELKDVINLPIHLVFDKNGNPVTIPMSFIEMGYSFGDIISVHVGNSLTINESKVDCQKDIKHMASIILKMGVSGVTVPVNDIKLDQVTNTELISQMVASGIAPALPSDEEYLVIGKNNQPLKDTASLAELGFNDGDTITIAVKPKGAK